MAEKKVGDTTLVHQSKTNMNHPVEERGITVLTSKELDYFRSLILERRQEAVEDIDHMKKQLADSQEQAANDSAYSSHMADAGTDAMEREKSYLMIARQQKYIGYLDQALERISNRSYGICKVTGKPISKERLEAVPHTGISIEAKRKQKKQEGKKRRNVVQKTGRA